MTNVPSTRGTTATVPQGDPRRWHIERVSTPMTKGGGFACGARGHHRADVHLPLVHDDTLHAPCHPWSALGKRQLVHRRLPAVPQRLDALGPGRHMDVLLGLGSAVPEWLHEALWALRHLLSSACTRRTRAHLCQGDSEPPRGLAFERRQDSTQRLTSRVEGLGQPGAPLGPFPCRRAEGRLPQATAEGLPHPLVHRRRGGLARWAARAAGDPPRLRPPPTAVIRGTGGHGATAAGASPWATAEQAAASLRLRRLMAAGQGHVTLHAAAGRVRPREAPPGEGGERRRPRPAAPCQRFPPRGVGSGAALRRWATGDQLGVCPGAVSQATMGSTTAAGTGSRRPRRGSRGRSGARRAPEGARGHGHRGPRRRVAWRPRRLRSARRGRSSSATAARLCHRRCACGASCSGRSTHATRPPRGVRASTKRR